MMTNQIDLKKIYSNIYNPSVKTPSIAHVPDFNYLMIDGHGDPNSSQEYQEAVSALYSLVYGIKFQLKKITGMDYVVMPLEGLWWVEDMSTFTVQAKEDWLWTMMILQPEVIHIELVHQVREDTFRKKKLRALNEIRFESYAEGECVQIMHIGPFANEGVNIAWMHAYAAELGYHPAGKHHEIYLSDYTRTTPEKLRTVLRQPIQK